MRTSLLVLLAAPLAGPLAAVSARAEGPTSGYHKGFFIESADGDHSLKLNARVQARFAFRQEDTDPGDLNYGAFSIPAARLKTSGHAYGKDVKYLLQVDFSKGGAALKDAAVQVTVLPGSLLFTIGQFKRLFSRQELASSSKLELLERALTGHAFGTGRDIGLTISNDIKAIPAVEWALGLFNGTGDKAKFSGAVQVDRATGLGRVDSGAKFTNVPPRLHPRLVARAAYNVGKIKGYSEADLEGGGLRASIGAAGSVDFDGDDDNVNQTRATVDCIIKTHGFSASAAGFVLGDGPEAADQTRRLTGFYLQVGHVFSQRYQPVLRYALINPQHGDAVHERAAGVSVYFHGHGLKWQTEGAQIAEGNLTDYRALSQVQIAF